MSKKFRQLTGSPFEKSMNFGPMKISMNSNTSKGFSPWVNKDIREAEQSGDWGPLLEKAQKSRNRFRNDFYR